MKVLVGCEFSGVVREAFRAAGHDAWSCDLLPTEIPGPHFQGDLLDVLAGPRQWDLAIFHPPCTFLSNSGVRWLYKDGKRDEDRWAKMKDGAEFFRFLLEQGAIPRIAIENPVIHGHARKIIGRGADFTIQPWQFGHPEVKRTCFWTKGLPKLEPTNIVEGREARVHRAAPSPDRWKERSRTYVGLAKAIAAQWGVDQKAGQQSHM